MTIVVSRNYFSGDKLTYSKAPNGLAAIIRGLAQDNARLRLKMDPATDMTDNSTGTAAGAPYAIVDVPLPTAAGPAGAAAAGVTAFNAAIAAATNAHSALLAEVNLSLAILGLPAVTDNSSGTVATVGTAPAITNPTADAGSAPNYTSADFASGVAALTLLKSNQRSLMTSFYGLLQTIGAASTAGIVSPATFAAQMGLQGVFPEGDGLLLVGTALSTAVTTTPASAVTLASSTAFFAALKNNISTLIACWNAQVVTAEGSFEPLQVVAGF